MTIDVKCWCIREDGPAKFWNVELYCEEGKTFPVGTAYVLTAGDHSQLNFFFVADQWRGRGYGKALWEAVRERWPKITFTTPMNDTAKRILSGKRTKNRRRGKLPLSEQLRKAIDGSELSRYRIAKEAGVAQSTISQFMNGKRSLSLKAIDRIAELLDLELAVVHKGKFPCRSND